MSTNRYIVTAGWVNPNDLPKGENGRTLCRWCGNEVPKGRRTFCSDECVHQHKLRSSASYLREQVLQRDQGICAVCKLDCGKVEKVFRSLVKKAGLKRWKWPDTIIRNPDRYGALDMFRQQFPWFRPHLSAWATDHILPVVEGGGECGIENIRTLCLGCHNTASKELRERLRKHKSRSG
jgi:5-methylcytosine-specific restriction endonuclease McrA